MELSAQPPASSRSAPPPSRSPASACAASIPYGVESRDLGGWTEVIERGRAPRHEARRAARDRRPRRRAARPLPGDARASRTATTACIGALDLPESRADVIEAVERGDMRAGSLADGRRPRSLGRRHPPRRGDRRARDVAIVGAESPPTPTPPIEYRASTGGERRQRGADMSPAGDRRRQRRRERERDRGAHRVRDRGEPEQRTEESSSTDCSGRAARLRAAAGLADELPRRGFPGEPRVRSVRRVPRADPVSGTTTSTLSRVERAGVALGADTR